MILGSFRVLVPYFWGVLIRRILLFSVLYWGPLFSETPRWGLEISGLSPTLPLHKVWGLGLGFKV